MDITSRETEEFYDYIIQSDLTKLLPDKKEAFATHQERLKDVENPYEDEDFSNALLELESLEKEIISELMNHPKFNDNRAMINFCQWLKQNQEQHSNHIQNCDPTPPCAPGV